MERDEHALGFINARKNNIKFIKNSRKRLCHGCGIELPKGYFALRIGSDPEDIATILCLACIKFVGESVYHVNVHDPEMEVF